MPFSVLPWKGRGAGHRSSGPHFLTESRWKRLGRNSVVFFFFGKKKKKQTKTIINLCKGFQQFWSWNVQEDAQHSDFEPNPADAQEGEALHTGNLFIISRTQSLMSSNPISASAFFMSGIRQQFFRKAVFYHMSFTTRQQMSGRAYLEAKSFCVLLSSLWWPHLPAMLCCTFGGIGENSQGKEAGKSSVIYWCGAALGSQRNFWKKARKAPVCSSSRCCCVCHRSLCCQTPELLKTSPNPLPQICIPFFMHSCIVMRKLPLIQLCDVCKPACTYLLSFAIRNSFP